MLISSIFEQRRNAALMAVLAGPLGLHKFSLGYTNEGVITLLVSCLGGLVTCGLAWVAMAFIGIIEGLTYVAMTDEQFQETYIDNRRPWF
jgi:TM2 domain-containing membrane protein YozV